MMWKAKVIGFTGGAGSGKTTLLRVWQGRGIPVLSADLIGRLVVQKGSPTLQALVATFGRTVLTPKGELDRRKVRRWLFSHPQALRRVNRLTHPPMCRVVEAWLREKRGQGFKLIGVEAAVLFEMGLRRCVHEVWVITAGRRERIRRLEQMGWERSEISRALSRQLSEAMFTRRAHRVMVTDRGRVVGFPFLKKG